DRFFKALNGTIYNRCWHLSALLKEVSTRDASEIFPHIMEEIFGTTSGQGWNLQKWSPRIQLEDWQGVTWLLSPGGDVMHLVYKLMSDPSLKFKVPVHLLPKSSYEMLQRGGMNAFYADKIHHLENGNMELLLNPFDFFIFHLVYALVNPSKRQESCMNPLNTVQSAYEALIEEYLAYFFPCDGSSPSVPSTGISPPSRFDSVQKSPAASAFNRVLVKRILYFYNSAHPASLHPWDEFKRNALVRLQRPLYPFLKTLFDRWPLDASFRLLLETWLSYIQPWRYTDPAVAAGLRENQAQEGSRMVDRHWKKWIGENLLFYSVIFQACLPRFLRMDLLSARNAVLLYRFTKIFALENLAPIIQELEQELMGQGEMSHGSSHHAVALRQHILVLEGPGYHYKHLFCDQVYQQIKELMGEVQAASNTLKARIQVASATQGHLASLSTIQSLVKSVRFLLSGEMRPLPEESAQELTKHQGHISAAMLYLSNIFQLEVPQDITRVKPHLSYEESFLTPPPSPPSPSTTPVSIVGRGGTSLTSQEREEILRGWRKSLVVYGGDPDLAPICSYEIAWLVRILYHIAQYFNRNYSALMEDLYHQDSYWGAVSREILQSPMDCRETKKLDVGKWNEKTIRLPPRLSLRAFATRQQFAFLAFLFLLGWYAFSLDPVTVGLLVFTAVMAYFMTRAAFVTAKGRLMGRPQNQSGMHHEPEMAAGSPLLPGSRRD
ncbi:unnamed protein product, partial [Darwinula stevensoni]